MSPKTQQANPIAIILSRPSTTPLTLSKGSVIFFLKTIINTHVANPKMQLTPTTTPHAMSAILRHRCDRIDTVVQRPSNNTPTTRTTAAHMREKSSITRVKEPIARRTRQNIVGTSDIYNQAPSSKARRKERRGEVRGQLTVCRVI